jgi:hypothetical protein
MTCNQLMVLLDIYRGTLDTKHHMPTMTSDLAYLLQNDFIYSLPGRQKLCHRYNITDLGGWYVMKTLSIKHPEDKPIDIGELLKRRGFTEDEISKMIQALTVRVI